MGVEGLRDLALAGVRWEITELPMAMAAAVAAQPAPPPPPAPDEGQIPRAESLPVALDQPTGLFLARAALGAGIG